MKDVPKADITNAVVGSITQLTPPGGHVLGKPGIVAEIGKLITPPVSGPIIEAKPLSTYVYAYLSNDILTEKFKEVSTIKKLAILQKTPKRYVKKRIIGGKNTPYVPYTYAQKALNVVFNFNVSTEILKSEIVIGKTADNKTIYEASAEVKFTFFDSDSKRDISRTVIATHKAFANPALTSKDALKSAISKAWTIVAGTFGIGKDLLDVEESAYEDLNERYAKGEQNQEKPKSFVTGSHSPVNFNPNF